MSALPPEDREGLVRESVWLLALRVAFIVGRGTVVYLFR
ncbi:DUF7156 family protein [Nocardioides panzhihuensis]|uniref:Uncharacterized protein n=1 Tax=Nocardioides panzhihuensis TaxID=860243 RepID=A0A7Z0DH76_9ACTN|nr:hypothetical protein [Nocardioides panzhihuensis]